MFTSVIKKCYKYSCFRSFIVSFYYFDLKMSSKGVDSLKRFLYLASKFSKKLGQKSGEKSPLTVNYFGVFVVVGTASVFYLSKKYGLTPTLLASEERKKKKIVVLGTGWAAVNFLRYTCTK